MLTVKQLLAVTTRRSVPPWHARDLREVFKNSPGSSISIRSVINGIQEQKLILFIEIRDLSLMKSAKSLKELQAIWKDATPTLVTLKELADLLGSVGGSIKFLSADRLLAGISGQIEALGKLPTARLTTENYDGIRDVADSLEKGGAILCAIALFPEPASPVLFEIGVGIGSVGVGITFGLGLIEMLSGPTPVQTSGGPIEGTGEVVIPEVTIYGTVPSGLDPGNIIDMPAFDLSDLPDDPPPPEPIPEP
jgi:hypothetical protein